MKKPAFLVVMFAKNGDPGGNGVPAWPAFSDANPVVMHFN